MDKQLRREKKKAQYARRIRALEEQVYKLQQLVKMQHELLRVPSTTHTPYPQHPNQMPTIPQYLESSDSTLASEQEPQTPL